MINKGIGFRSRKSMLKKDNVSAYLFNKSTG